MQNEMKNKQGQADAANGQTNTSPAPVAEGNLPATGTTNKTASIDFDTRQDPYPHGVDPDLMAEINEELALFDAEKHEHQLTLNENQDQDQ